MQTQRTDSRDHRENGTGSKITRTGIIRAGRAFHKTGTGRTDRTGTGRALYKTEMDRIETERPVKAIIRQGREARDLLMAAGKTTEATDRRAQGRIEELTAAIGRARTIIKAASAAAILMQAAKGASVIAGAIAEAMEGREITSESRAQAKALWQRLQSRMPKSIEMKKSAASVRRRISAPARTLSMKRKMHR